MTNMESSEQPRDILLYLISSEQWNEAVALYQQEFGTNRTDARVAVSELAENYGYVASKRTAAIMLIAAFGLSLFFAAGVLHYMNT